MIHARRQESGISRSRASRSDRLYRVSCLFVHFLAPFPPLSHRHLTLSLLRSFPSHLLLFSLFSLLFHAWPATENRELSALPRPYALSLFLGLVVTHTGEKRRANRQPTTREWRPVETSPGLVNPAFFRSDYSIPSIWRTTCVISSTKYQRIVIDTRVNFLLLPIRTLTRWLTRVFSLKCPPNATRIASTVLVLPSIF